MIGWTPMRAVAKSRGSHELLGLRWCALCLIVLALTVTPGCKDKQTASVGDVTSGGNGEDAATDAPEDDGVDVAMVNYQAIAERDPFRPLVNAPRQAGAGGGGGGGTSAKPSGPSGNRPTTPPTPPDPTADLALTGIMESTDGLQVLVEKISTGEGVFAGVGDTVFGFEVQEVEPGIVRLVQGAKTHELKLGEKEIGEKTPAAKPTEGDTKSGEAPKDAATPTGPGGMPDFGSMSDAQRRAAMEQWRQRFENMSPEQRESYRNQMRSRWGGRGGGRGGPGRGRGGR